MLPPSSKARWYLDNREHAFDKSKLWHGVFVNAGISNIVFFLLPLLTTDQDHGIARRVVCVRFFVCKGLMRDLFSASHNDRCTATESHVAYSDGYNYVPWLDNCQPSAP